MKKLVFAAALALATISASQSEARSLENSVSAPLTRFEIQNASSLSDRRINGGRIQVDLSRNELTLTLNPGFYCPPGAMCLQVMPAPIQFSAKGVEVTHGSCNQTVFTAIEDHRIADGSMTKITVTDNRSNNCLYFMAIPSTEVTLETISLHGREERHHFEAQVLR